MTPMVTKAVVEAMEPPKNIFRRIDKALNHNVDWRRRGVSPKDMAVSGIDAETILWIYVRPNALPHTVAKATCVSLLEKIVEDTGMTNTVLMKLLGFTHTLQQAKRFAFGEIDEGEFRAVYANANTDGSYWRLKEMALSPDRQEKIEQAAYLVTTYLMPSLTQAPNAAINAIRHMAHYINEYRANAASVVLNAIIGAAATIEEKNIGADFGNELMLREPNDALHATIEEVKPGAGLNSDALDAVTPSKSIWDKWTSEDGELGVVGDNGVSAADPFWHEGNNGTSAPVPVEVIPQRVEEMVLSNPIAALAQQISDEEDEEENIPPAKPVELSNKLADFLRRPELKQLTTPPKPKVAPQPAFDVSGIADEDEMVEEPEAPMQIGEETPEISLMPKTA